MHARVQRQKQLSSLKRSSGRTSSRLGIPYLLNARLGLRFQELYSHQFKRAGFMSQF